MSGGALHGYEVTSKQIRLSQPSDVLRVFPAMPEPRAPFQLDTVTVCRADHGSDAAAHDPLILRSLNRFSVSNHLALVRGDSFLPQKNIRLLRSGNVEEAVPTQRANSFEYRLSESARRIPSLRSRCPIDESK